MDSQVKIGDKFKMPLMNGYYEEFIVESIKPEEDGHYIVMRSLQDTVSQIRGVWTEREQSRFIRL